MAIAWVDNPEVGTVQVDNQVAFTVQAANPEGFTGQAVNQDTAVYRQEEATYREVSQVAVLRQVVDLYRSQGLLLAMVMVQ